MSQPEVKRDKAIVRINGLLKPIEPYCYEDSADRVWLLATLKYGPLPSNDELKIYYENLKELVGQLAPILESQSSSIPKPFNFLLNYAVLMGAEGTESSSVLRDKIDRLEKTTKAYRIILSDPDTTKRERAYAEVGLEMARIRLISAEILLKRTFPRPGVKEDEFANVAFGLLYVFFESALQSKAPFKIKSLDGVNFDCGKRIANATPRRLVANMTFLFRFRPLGERGVGQRIKATYSIAKKAWSEDPGKRS